MNYLDRNALASARVQGIEKSLGMKGTDFNTAIAILFVGYILGQVPSNYILSRSRPSWYLAGFVALWGAVSSCTGAVDTYEHLLVVRFFLGITESPYFPGALFLLSSWYTKRELALRTALLYTGSLLSGAFSGLIAAGIQKGLDGNLGLESWRWLFIIEGVITVGFAIAAIFILPDYPASTKWLSMQERAIAVHRLAKDSGHTDGAVAAKGLGETFKLVAKDPNFYVLALIIITKTTAGAVTQFLPTVVNTFGMSKVNTLLLTTPPYIFTLIVSLIVSWSSDRKPERCFHLMGPLFVGLVGFIIAVTTKATAPRYFSLFLMLGGLFGSYNVALAWISSTFPQPKEKRALAYGMINGLGNCAQIWSPYLYKDTEKPGFRTAFITNAVMTVASILFCFLLRFMLKRANAKLDKKEADEADDPEINDTSKAEGDGSEKASQGEPTARSTAIRYVL